MITYKPIRYKIKCCACNVMLYFDKDDIKKYTHSSKNIKESFSEDYIVCPICKKHIMIGGLDGLTRYKYYKEA